MDDQQIEAVASRITKALAESIEQLSRRERLAYTIDEAAPLVGLARNTLRDAAARGELKATKRGQTLDDSERFAYEVAGAQALECIQPFDGRRHQ